MNNVVSGNLSTKDTRLNFEVQQEKEMGLEDKMLARDTTGSGCEF